MKQFLTAIFAPVIMLFGCKAKTDTTPAVRSVTIAWTHPKVSGAPPVTIADAQTVRRLIRLFEGIDQPAKGVPYDTPFYDAALTFELTDGRTVVTKVYLPRARTFPGMWKHPAGHLCYFDSDEGQSRELVAILKPLMPRHAVYPESLVDFPPVQFNKGIPDFTDVDLPISGDFPKGYFQPGG